MYECTNDSECEADERCENHSCVEIECGYFLNHSCVVYECCFDVDVSGRYGVELIGYESKGSGLDRRVATAVKAGRVGVNWCGFSCVTLCVVVCEEKERG